MYLLPLENVIKNYKFHILIANACIGYRDAGGRMGQLSCSFMYMYQLLLFGTKDSIIVAYMQVPA